MYKSPIEIVEDIQEKVTLSMENNVVRAVQAVGINIDKHELIAALMQDKSRYEAAYEQGKRDAEKHGRWIPVSERLPKDTVIVTVETKTFKHKYVCEAIWIPRWTWKAEFDNWEDCSEYNEDEDEYYVLEGWYERVHNWDEYSFVGIEDKVIAWMPLPEPWKGEEG